MPDILKILKSWSSWDIYLFFTQKEPLLGGETPLQSMKHKKWRQNGQSRWNPKKGG